MQEVMEPKGTPALVGLLAAAVMSVMVLGCTTTPLGPSEQGPLRLRGEITQATIPPGETAILRFRLENVGPLAITLTFPSSCRIRPYVTNRTTSQVVHPPGGGWVCLAVITHLEVPPGGAVVEEVHLTAGAPHAPILVGLPPGEYSAIARVEAASVQLRSDPVLFSVR
jgi:hypothetical protein